MRQVWIRLANVEKAAGLRTFEINRMRCRKVNVLTSSIIKSEGLVPYVIK